MEQVQALIDKTGQRWKLWSGNTLAYTGAIAVLSAAFVEVVHRVPFLFEVLLFGGFSMFAVGAFVVVRCIQCPKCGCRFVWHEIRTVDFETWLSGASQTQSCPACGFLGGDGVEDR